jgi:hypothetical protein
MSDILVHFGAILLNRTPKSGGVPRSSGGGQNGCRRRWSCCKSDVEGKVLSVHENQAYHGKIQIVGHSHTSVQCIIGIRAYYVGLLYGPNVCDHYV